MPDVILCPTCGGNLEKPTSSLEELYTCDVCGHRLEDGVHIPPAVTKADFEASEELRLLDPEGPEIRANQMSINFDFLLKHIDTIHAALCSEQKHWQYRTWQQRAEAAAKTAQEIAAELKYQKDKK